MKRLGIVIAIFTIVLLFVSSVEAKTVEITNTTDSKMRPYLESSTGNVPSAGHYAYWSIYVKSPDVGKWVTLGFHFDNRLEKVKVWASPYSESYVYATGYMKNFTNKVDVTLEDW